MFASLHFKLIVWTSALALVLGAGVLSYLLEPPSTLKINGRLKPSTANVAARLESSFSNSEERSPGSFSSGSSPSSENSSNSAPTSDPLRAPASSIGLRYSTISLDDRSQLQAIDLELPCQGRSLFTSNVSFVRLLGDQCSRDTAPTSIEVTNQANGFSATVFPNGVNYQTDYISLAAGQNPIRVVKTYSDGRSEEIIHVIERETL